MNNHAITDSPLVGQTFTYHAEYPPYDPDLDREGGRMILANGWPVIVKAVFQNWNGDLGRNMLYVYVPATGSHTHILPGDLGLGGITTSDPRGHNGFRMFDNEAGDYSLSDCQWWDQPASAGRTFDCWGRVGKTGDGKYSVLCEGHLNGKAAGR